MRIDQAGKAVQASAPSRPRRAQAGFMIPQDGDAGSAEPATMAAAVPAILIAGTEPLAADAGAGAAAAQQAAAVLDALSGLQLALLGGACPEARQALADAASRLPGAADPRLEAALQAVAVRAAVELARSG